MSDEISSGEGAQPPNKLNPVRRRRSRKLTGPAAAALGELAFALYSVAAGDMRNDDRWKMLQAKLLAWRALYLP